MRSLVYYAVLSALLAAALYEAALQRRETLHVRQVAQEAARGANTDDARSVVVALRDYVRRNVRHEPRAVYRDRPFLRATAAETLRAGKGDCGEATRVFINLAAALGIRARRLYLEGPRPHVVAEASLGGGREVVVDAYDEPFVTELETLEEVMRRPEFEHYSTINWRRLLTPLPPSHLRLGPLSLLLESPHAIKSLFWLALAAAWACLRLLRPPAVFARSLHALARSRVGLRPARREGA